MPNTKTIKILTAELEGDDGLILTFSDGTIAGYVAEEMLDLRPSREPAPAFITKIRPTHYEPYFPKDLPPAIG
jgi:hypothetical protein